MFKGFVFMRLHVSDVYICFCLSGFLYLMLSLTDNLPPFLLEVPPDISTYQFLSAHLARRQRELMSLYICVHFSLTLFFTYEREAMNDTEVCIILHFHSDKLDLFCTTSVILDFIN